MKNWTRLAIAILVVPALAACGGEEEAPEVVEQPAGAMGGMEGMQGMGGMQMGGGMMQEMRAHMQAMEGETGDQYLANLPRHRQMVANMVSQMNREMREMDMAADPEWDSTVEALREDLRRLPEMSAAELEGFMPEHRARVVRLLDMHQAMMADMQM